MLIRGAISLYHLRALSVTFPPSFNSLGFSRWKHSDPALHILSIVLGFMPQRLRLARLIQNGTPQHRSHFCRSLMQTPARLNFQIATMPKFGQSQS